MHLPLGSIALRGWAREPEPGLSWVTGSVSCELGLSCVLQEEQTGNQLDGDPGDARSYLTLSAPRW